MTDQPQTPPLNVAHVLPIAMTEFGTADDGNHEASPTCWCQPVYEDVPPNGRIYIHRRYLDGPAVEPKLPEPDRGLIDTEIVQ